jgi:hypothetical protein
MTCTRGDSRAAKQAGLGTRPPVPTSGSEASARSRASNALSVPIRLYVYELFILNRSDGTVRQLTSVGSYLGPGSVSPNGQSVVFLSDPERDHSFELWEIGVRGNVPHRIDVTF